MMSNAREFAFLAIGLFASTAYAQAQTNWFPPSGNVGIATTSPQQTLDVRGNTLVYNGELLLGGSNNFGGTSGAVQLSGNYASPFSGRLMFGDGTGWKFNISRFGPVDLVTFQDNGNVGIGTTSPQYNLDVSGSSRFSINSQVWGWPFTSTVVLVPTYHLINGIGNVGVLTSLSGSGTSSNANGLGSVALYANAAYLTSNNGNSAGGQFVDFLSNPASVSIQSGGGGSLLTHYAAMAASAYTLNSQPLSEYGFFTNLASSPANGVTAYAFFGSGSAPSYFGGNVGIGTATPSQRLEVNGNAQVDGSLSVGGGGIVFPNGGGVQTVAYTGITCGGDYAESIDVTGDRNAYAPGDLLVIDPDDPSRFQRSSEPYSTSVAGVFSTKPGTVGRRQSTPKTSDEVPMAVVGIVPTKVSAENGPIRPGDLLVSSSTLGFAMKGSDRNRMLGAVVGKAMGSLESGSGVIEVLVTLQ